MKKAYAFYKKIKTTLKHVNKTSALKEGKGSNSRILTKLEKVG